MREILFKAKRLDNGEWVEGHPVKRPSCIQFCLDNYSPWYIHRPAVDPDDNGGVYNIDPETIGQYIGLKDRNGRRIFEGDIVDILTENEEIGVVEYDEGGFLVSADGFCVDFHSNINGIDLVVIGNIHDTPELLEGGAAE